MTNTLFVLCFSFDSFKRKLTDFILRLPYLKKIFNTPTNVHHMPLNSSLICTAVPVNLNIGLDSFVVLGFVKSIVLFSTTSLPLRARNTLALDMITAAPLGISV